MLGAVQRIGAEISIMAVGVVVGVVGRKYSSMTESDIDNSSMGECVSSGSEPGFESAENETSPKRRREEDEVEHMLATSPNKRGREDCGEMDNCGGSWGRVRDSLEGCRL